MITSNELSKEDCDMLFLGLCFLPDKMKDSDRWYLLLAKMMRNGSKIKESEND